MSWWLVFLLALRRWETIKINLFNRLNWLRHSLIAAWRVLWSSFQPNGFRVQPRDSFLRRCNISWSHKKELKCSQRKREVNDNFKPLNGATDAERKRSQIACILNFIFAQKAMKKNLKFRRQSQATWICYFSRFVAGFESWANQVKGFISKWLRLGDITSDASLSHFSLVASKQFFVSFSMLQVETRAWKMASKTFSPLLVAQQTIVRVTKCLFCFQAFSTF